MEVTDTEVTVDPAESVVTMVEEDSTVVSRLVVVEVLEVVGGSDVVGGFVVVERFVVVEEVGVVDEGGGAVVVSEVVVGGAVEPAEPEGSAEEGKGVVAVVSADVSEDRAGVAGLVVVSVGAGAPDVVLAVDIALALVKGESKSGLSEERNVVGCHFGPTELHPDRPEDVAD